MWRLIGSLCSVCKTNIISTIVDSGLVEGVKLCLLD